MTVVIGTAGHIDHGKTTLLRALTGIDADRLPEEQRRGMTIDVGYAHMQLPDGDQLDFVDVPGHDRLVGNMLVGAGEIDAALLVVAADEGPAAQTIEHLELLDALGIGHGIGVITKLDLLEADDPRRVLAAAELSTLLSRTSLAGAPVLEVSATEGTGLPALVAALARLRDRVVAGRAASRPGSGPVRLAVDRAFGVRGRGVVVTGTLVGSLERGNELRIEPGGRAVRVREVQVHGRSVQRVDGGGRTACNLAGPALGEVSRGAVLAAGPGVAATDRLLVALRAPAQLGGAVGRRRDLHDGEQVRLHLGTDQAEAVVRGPGRGRFVGLERTKGQGLSSGEVPAVLRLARPVAAAVGDRFVLRWPSPAGTAAGGRILDLQPPAGASRRRVTPDRLARVVAARLPDEAVAALVELHGVLAAERAAAISPETDQGPGAGVVSLGAWLVAPDVEEALAGEALEAVTAHGRGHVLSGGMPVALLRAALARSVRRRVSLDRVAAARLADALASRLVADERLTRDGELVRLPGEPGGLPSEVLAAMDRLEASLTGAMPPSLDEAARAAGCPPEGTLALEREGRIVRLDGDVAYAAATYRELERLALDLTGRGPLTPAAFRDATGTSRRYALAVLEDLDRRALLRRTPDGHVRGARAPRESRAATAADRLAADP